MNDSISAITRSKRARGVFLGLAVGTTVEFKPRGTVTPMTEMIRL